MRNITDRDVSEECMVQIFVAPLCDQKPHDRTARYSASTLPSDSPNCKASLGVKGYTGGAFANHNHFTCMVSWTAQIMVCQYLLWGVFFSPLKW